MIDAIIVIYNKKIEDSITYQNLKNDTRLKFIIYDNSINNQENREFAQKNNIVYFGFGTNDGLSKAYNYSIKHTINDNNRYYMILDDDTIITDEYINTVYSMIVEDYDVIIPIVYSNNRIISPCKIQFDGRIRRIKSVDSTKNKLKISAINSGMVVKKSVYNSITYDERLFLDYVDHMFMKRVNENKMNIAIASIPIFQNFSRDQKTSINSAKTRFSIFKKDYKIYCKSYKNPLLYYLSINKFRLKNFLMYKKFFL